MADRAKSKRPAHAARRKGQSPENGAGAEEEAGVAGSSGPSTATGNGSLTEPTDSPGRKKRRDRYRHRAPRRHRGLKWAIGIFVILLVVLIGSVAGYGWYLNHQIHRVYVKDLEPAPKKGVDMTSENILMVGSTSRCALPVQATVYGLCAQGVTGVNSDVVMILHLNPVGPRVSILSIPRDLFVPNARKEGAYKIDAALYEGPDQLVAAIEEDFGIPIQHYVELNFDSFGNVVNALGGINMYFPMEVYDQYSNLDIQTTGCLHLNGWQALEVVRARHLQYKGPGITSDDPAYWPQEAQSDLARIRRDHEFLRVLAAAVAKKGLGNPVTDFELVGGVAPQLTVDNSLTPKDMLNLLLTYHGVNAAQAPMYTLPVLVGQFGDYVYDGSDYGDVEFPDQPLDQSVIDQFLGVAPGTDTMNGGALPPASSVTVSVLSGTYDGDEAASTAYALGLDGFNVVGQGYSTPVGQEAETLVTYDQMTPADEAAAQAVAERLSGSVALDYGQTFDGADVTVTTGTNFSVNSPPASPPVTTTTVPVRGVTTTTSPPTTTTTTEPPEVADGTFAPPSPSVEPLAPWDPRSCTPTGGEGP